MRTTPNLGLTVWDSVNDPFSSSQLATNWDLVDANAVVARPANSVQVLTALPTTGLFEGELVYLSAADSGFTAGTLVRRTGSSWYPVQGVEVQSSVPSTGNFAGRIVLLSSAASGFAAWSLIRYDGSAWALLNYTYQLLSAVPVSNLFAGQLVMLTSADSGFNAFDLIRYNGSSWAKVGPQAIPPGTELASLTSNTDVSTTNTVSPGDTLASFSAATFENVKYYFEASLPWISHSISQGNAKILLRESTTTIVSADIPTANTATAPSSFSVRLPFTPTAGSHTYTVTYYTLTAGTFHIYGSSHGSFTVRIIKA